MARRIVIEEPCGHNLFHPHPVAQAGVPDCPGGTRRVLDPGSYLLVEKVDGEWPDWAVDQTSGTLRYGTWTLDILAEGEQP